MIERRPRRGIVLFAAIALIAVLTLLIAGAVATSRLTSRTTGMTTANARLDGDAELAANTVLAYPERFALSDLPFGTARTFDVGAPARSGSTVTVTRLRDGLLWVTGVATADGEQGARRINVLARLRSPAPVPAAPLVARGRIDVGSSTTFASDSGAEADCAARDTSVHVAVARDSAAFLLANAQRALLAAASTVNRLSHDTTLGAGSMSGILVADGRLVIAGPFRARGLIVARGSIVARGLDLEGAMMSFDSSAAPAIALDSSTVRYSPCAVTRELRRLLPPRRVHSRSWLEVF